MRTSFNLFGTDEALDEIRRELEAQHEGDPSFPWSFEFGDEDGPVIERDGSSRDAEHEFLLALSLRHPNVAFIAADVDFDEGSQEPVRITFVSYSKGCGSLPAGLDGMISVT